MSLSHTGFLVLLVLGVALFGAGQLVVARLMARLRPRLGALSRELELDWLGTGHSVLGRRPLVLVEARLLFSSLPPPMAADAEIVVLIRRLRRWALLEYGFMFGFAACLLMG